MGAKSAILAVKILGDAKGAQQAIGTTNKAVGGMVKFGGMAATALAGATVAAGALAVKVGVDAVKSAAGLEQSLGALDAVFKGGSGAMRKFGADASHSVGLSQNEFSTLATILGTQLKNGGTSIDQLGAKTTDLIKVGADLSAMFGGTTADAVGALSSALKGERDPIEKYGVSLNQAKIDAEAAALGFKKVGGSLSTEAQQAATLSLIMKQTTDAHGAFGREAGTLAHQQQVLGAQWENLKATLGQAFLPVITGVMTAFNGLVTQIGPLAGPMLAQLSSSLARVWKQAQPLVNGFTSGLIPAVRTFVTTAVMPLVQALITHLVPIIGMLARTLIPALKNAWTTILPALLQAAAAVAPLIDALGARLVPIIRGLLPVVTVVFAAVSTIIRAALRVITAVINVATNLLRGNWSGAWKAMGKLVDTVWAYIKTVISGYLSVIKALMTAIGPTLKSIWTAAWNAIKATCSSAWDAIKSSVSSGTSKVVTYFTQLPGRILGALAGLASRLHQAGVDAALGFIGGLGSMVERAANKAREMANAAGNAIKNALGINSPSRLTFGYAVDTGRGFINGLTKQASAVKRAAARLVNIPAAIAADAPRLTVSGTSSSSSSSQQQPVVINVSGALDPAAVARQIRDILNTDARRRGQVSINGVVMA